MKLNFFRMQGITITLYGQKSSDIFDFRLLVEHLEKDLKSSSETSEI